MCVHTLPVFIRDSGEVNGSVITKQTVFPQPFRPRTQGDVLGVW